MNIGRFSLTNELLCQLLHLPSGTLVVGATLSGDGRDVVLSVRHADIKQVGEGEINELSPRWSRHEPVQFDGWGCK